MSERMERLITRGVALAALALSAYYGLLGGEYTHFDLRALEQERAATAEDLGRLRDRVDSLQAWSDSLASDPLVIERVARERHGFVRPGELLFWFVPAADSAEADGP